MGMVGVMLDCSRNGVMTVKSIKKYVDIISKMGYNTLMLYTEDTYEVENEPLFGHMRGRYSCEEIREIDRYCITKGVELVPCIQTLAHLGCMFKWNAYDSVRDCDDILLIGEEKTYQLLDHMFSTISKCFSSKKIHIGMDEAYKVGLGKYMEKHGYQDRFDLINTHLHKVCEMLESYDLEPMVWSDMFCKLALNRENYYEVKPEDQKRIQEMAALPEKISLVYWDYYTDDYQNYVNMIDVNKAFGKKVYFAGGAWTWRGFAPDNTFSIRATKAAMRACKDKEIDGFFMTVWGDDGDECSKYAILPTLLYAAETANGNTDMDSIKKKFHDITGADFDTFMLLDQLDVSGGADNNKSKWMFYNDPFMGLHDFRCKKEDCAYYEALAKQLEEAPNKGEFQWLFDSYIALCRVLAIKADLGVRTRAYYQNKQMDELKALALQDYTEVIKRTEEFHSVYETMWMMEKKPFGFDMQDHRIGGVMQRLKSCRRRLLDYAEGRISEIPELEEKIADQHCGFIWTRCITPNQTSMF